MIILLGGLFLSALGHGAPGLLWNGSPVHPGCIRELRTDLADSKPVVGAVDLEGCGQSNRYPSSYEKDGAVLRLREEGGRGYFQYEYLGVLSTGVHLVRIGESGGGSGFFQALLFLRIDKRNVLEDGQQRARELLFLVGSESLGDRDQTVIELSGDAVKIRRRAFRGELGYGPEEVVIRKAP